MRGNQAKLLAWGRAKAMFRGTLYVAPYEVRNTRHPMVYVLSPHGEKASQGGPDSENYGFIADGLLRDILSKAFLRSGG
jgi:hypothetical protein